TQSLIRGTRQRSFDTFQQFGVSKWLGQKIDCASLHGLRTHRDVAMTSDEDQLFFPAPLKQKVLQIYPVYSWHTDIHDHASRPGVFVTREKIRRRTKRLVFQPSRAQ